MIWALFAFFAFPEWFGITGKKALEIQRHQQGDDPEVKNPTNKE